MLSPDLAAHIYARTARTLIVETLPRLERPRPTLFARTEITRKKTLERSTRTASPVSSQVTRSTMAQTRRTLDGPCVCDVSSPDERAIVQMLSPDQLTCVMPSVPAYMGCQRASPIQTRILADSNAAASSRPSRRTSSYHQIQPPTISAATNSSSMSMTARHAMRSSITVCTSRIVSRIIFPIDLSPVAPVLPSLHPGPLAEGSLI